MAQSDLNEAIMSFVELHPGQYTMSRIAELVSERSGFGSNEVLAEIRAMMGTQLDLSAARTACVRRERQQIATNPSGEVGSPPIIRG